MPVLVVEETEAGRDERPAAAKTWGRSLRIFHWSLVVLLASPVHGYAQSTDLSGVVPYREQCASCHGQDAAVQARRALKLDGPRVMLNRSGVLLDDFLVRHGRANRNERQELVALFLRILSEDKAR
jgi:mono/diheme cytochrome c family protein